MVAALGQRGFAADELTLRRAETTARRSLDRAIWARWREGPVPRTGWIEATVWGRFWREVLELAGADPYRSEELAETVLAVTRPAASWTRVDSGTPPVLDRLRRAGCRLGVVSNSSGGLAGHLGALGLAGRFDFILDSHHVGVEKPHPAIFELALRRAGGVPAGDALYVGDVYAIDVLGAAGAGLHAMLFDPLGQWDAASLPRDAPPCRAIASLAELEGIWERRSRS